MKEPTGENIVSQKDKSVEIVKVSPKSSPVLIEQWVVWEYSACIDTIGLKLDTAKLHDLVKAELEAQGIPVDIFFSEDACWIVEGVTGEVKLDQDRRPRIIATLRESPYADMQFIAGIDFFGDSNWANIQMMMIVQPSPRPIRPLSISASPLIPTPALVILGLVALGLVFSGNPSLAFLGLIGFLGLFVIFIQSTQGVVKAKELYEKRLKSYEEAEANWQREQEQLIKNRLFRSFKTDDFRVFHAIMVRTIARIISEELLKRGAAIKEIVENNNAQNVVESNKNIFDEF